MGLLRNTDDDLRRPRERFKKGQIIINAIRRTRGLGSLRKSLLNKVPCAWLANEH